MKKLKLRIAKFDKLLVVEQLERSGEWETSEHVFPNEGHDFFIGTDGIYICKMSSDSLNDILRFCNNQERDEIAANLVNWITEEQFGGAGKLEIGKPCLVSNDGVDWLNDIYAGNIRRYLKENYYCTLSSLDNLICWKYAKLLNSAQPKIDGEIYTWEVEE